MATSKKPIEKKKRRPVLPPAGGEVTLPEIQQFNAILNAATRVYYTKYDEAITHDPVNVRRMERAPIIREPLLARFYPSSEAPWHLEPENARDAEQVKVCKHLTRIIEDIPNFTDYRLWLNEAIYAGRSAVQNVYEYRIREGQMELFVKEWFPVHPDSLVWQWGKEERMGVLFYPDKISDQGMVKRDWIPTDRGRATFLTPDERKAFVVNHGYIRQAPYEEGQKASYFKGVGLREYLYMPYYMRTEAVAWLMKFIERVGLGTRIARYPLGNKKAREAVAEAVKNICLELIALWPVSPSMKGFQDLEILEAPQGGAQQLLEIIDRFFDSQIRRLILGQSLTSTSDDVGLGSSGIAGAHENTFTRVVRHDCNKQEGSLTKDLIKILLEWNYPGYPYSIKFKIDLEKPDPEKWLQAAKYAYDMGIKISASQVRSMCGLTTPDPDEEIIEKPDALQLQTPQGGHLLTEGKENAIPQ